MNMKRVILFCVLGGLGVYVVMTSVLMGNGSSEEGGGENNSYVEYVGDEEEGEKDIEGDKEVEEESHRFFDETEEDILSYGKDPFKETDEVERKYGELEDEYRLALLEIEREEEMERLQDEKEAQEDQGNGNGEVGNGEVGNGEVGNGEVGNGELSVDQVVLEKVWGVSEKYDIDYALILAIIEYGSDFDTNKELANNNGTYSRGLMQINSNTAPWLAGEIGIDYSVGVEFNEGTNVEMGAYYLAHVRDIKSNEGLHYMLTAYHRGPTGADNWKDKEGSYESGFSREVLKLAENYR